MTKEILCAKLYDNTMAVTQTLCASNYFALKNKNRIEIDWVKEEKD